MPLASGRGHADALEIHQDATLFGSLLQAGQELEITLEPDRQAYMVLATGQVDVEDDTGDTVGGRETLKARDGAVISATPRVKLTAREDREVLLADLPTAQ
ncbi:hypothetical protein [Fodinicurvata sediminis]|uniref:pirin family protein n=1 Tax=Fodinicurvata sediminis TaxID=1121832 RepID=UPI003F580705